MSTVDDRPRHQPIAPDAPIPGRHWFSGCDPDLPHVAETDNCECGHWSRHHTVGKHDGCGHCDCKGFKPLGKCEGCGETVCFECGAGFYPDGGCQCKEES